MSINLGAIQYKLALTWPIEPIGLKEFVADHQEVLVVEEKRGLIEDQVARLLMTMDAKTRPELSGKMTPNGETLLPSDGELRPHLVAEAIAKRLQHKHDWAQDYLDELAAQKTEPLNIAAPVRTPAFCSGYRFRN